MAAASSPAVDLDEAPYYQALGLVERGNLVGAVAGLEVFLGQNPEHAGAWLDLAIISCQLGKRERKDSALIQLQRLSERELLPSVLSELMLRLASENCLPSVSAAENSGGLFRIGVGRAHNLNYGAAQSTLVLPDSTILRLGDRMLPRTSDYVSSEFAWQQALPLVQESVRLSALFQGGIQEYARAPDYSMRNMSLSLLAKAQYDQSDGVYGLTYGNLQLGGDGYLQMIGLRSHWQKPIGGGLSLGAGLAYTKLAYAQGAFDGHLFEPGVTLAKAFLDKGMARTEFNLVSDVAANDRPGGDRTGLTWSFGVVYSIWGGQHLNLNAKLTHLEDSTPYLPALFGSMRRRSTQYQVNLSNAWQIGREQRLRLEWRYQQQDDALSLFSYSARNLGFTWEYLLN